MAFVDDKSDLKTLERRQQKRRHQHHHRRFPKKITLKKKLNQKKQTKSTTNICQQLKMSVTLPLYNNKQNYVWVFHPQQIAFFFSFEISEDLPTIQEDTVIGLLSDVSIGDEILTVKVEVIVEWKVLLEHGRWNNVSGRAHLVDGAKWWEL